MKKSAAKILIVDDEPMNLSLLKRILGGSSTYQITTLGSGSDAWASLQHDSYDLMLLDMMMPDISGLDLLSLVRSQHGPDRLPVIMVSAVIDEQQIIEALDAGANDYITKPFAPELVLARVRTQVQSKRLSDQSAALISELEQSNQIRNYLLRIASHDLKSPLHNVSMVLNLMEESSELSQDLQQLVGHASKSARTMTAIVEQFLDLNLLRNDRIQVDIQPLNLAQLLSEVLLEYDGMAADKGIHFDIHLDEVFILADADHFNHALTNLVTNAIKYSPVGREVRVYSEIRLDDGVAVIHVVDQGAGIPIEEQHQLFEPFSRISTQPTRGETSTGIGLWVAREMMALQQGEIGLDTPPTGGSDFWLQLPLAHLDQMTTTVTPSKNPLFL